MRLWLRLLSLHNLIDSELRRRLQERFGCTLPQFDVLSELQRAAEPQTMSQVSRQLMVSNGNVTGLAARLKFDGLIEAMAGTDRRVQRVRLTPLGRTRFTAMARAHEHWIEALFADLTTVEADDLTRLLERTKRSLHVTTHEELNG